MKRDIANFVSQCLACEQVEAKHQTAIGLHQNLEAPKWKWERVTMDFLTRLPKTTKGHDSIGVIVDCLTKNAHFFPMKTTYSTS